MKIMLCSALKNQLKRIVCVLLILSMMFTFLVSCSGDQNVDKNDGKTTKPSDTTADPDAITTYLEPLNDELKALDYEGRPVVMLGRSGNDDWDLDEFTVEELINEPINDAIYNRNMVVSDLLGVEIVQADKGDNGGINDKVSKMVNSGDTTYDIVAGSVYYSTPLVLSGYVYNLYDNGIETYLDTKKLWWPQYWIEEAEIEDRLYVITGPASLTFSRSMFVTYFNKNMAENHGIENLYEVVDRGDWTIDYCSELVSSLYRDLNGNSTKDVDDEYGMATNLFENADVYWSSFDMSVLSRDSDGWFELSSDKEKISKAFEKIYDLFYNNTGVYSYHGDMDTNFLVQRDMFANGTVLLTQLHLYYAESKEFRNMQDEYGIIPTPKYDKAQDEYYTYAHDQYSIFMIPSTVEDPVLSGAVLEALTYESYKSLQPVYYDLVLKGRYANDAQSRNMLDMITENIKVDGEWIYASILDSPAASVFRTLIEEGETTFASAYAAMERKLTNNLKKNKKIMQLIDY